MNSTEIIKIDDDALSKDGKLSSYITWLGDRIPGGFFIYKADGNLDIIYVNQATLKIFGCDSLEEFRELTGNTFRGLVHPDDYESVSKTIWEQISHDDMDYLEYRIIRKDGQVRWVDDFGHYTEKAVAAFQKANGLTEDGVVWPQTMEQLYHHHKFGEWELVKEASYETAAEYERVCEDCGFADKKEVGVLLLPGASGEEVKTLQKRLNELGYSIGQADGLYGDATKRAVKNYQEDQGFDTDGIAWPGVWTALFPEDAAELPAAADKAE